MAPGAPPARLGGMEDRPLILVATDGSEQALAAARVAIELASATGRRLLFVTAWKELRGDLGVPIAVIVQDFVEAERDWARDTAAAGAALAQEAGVEAETAIRHGDAGREVCEAARERGVDMVVMGSHGFGAVSAAVLGSVSAYVLRHAPCPVLVVRAEGGEAEAEHAEPPARAAAD